MTEGTSGKEELPAADGLGTESSARIRLERLAGAERLLVASDFDGTLAPIAQRPEDVVPDPAAVAALNGLAALPDTSAAILSGRPVEELRRLIPGLDDAVRLVGSHGAELAADVALTPAARELRARVVRVLDEIAGPFPGALVERKPLGIALHVRRVEDALQDELLATAETALDLPPDVRVIHGRKVLEIVLTDADKGTALEALRREVGATGTLFLGDDVTDEDGFRVLSSGDVGIKIGRAPSIATGRLARQTDVAALLEELRARRARASDAGGDA